MVQENCRLHVTALFACGYTHLQCYLLNIY